MNRTRLEVILTFINNELFSRAGIAPTLCMFVKLLTGE